MEYISHQQIPLSFAIFCLIINFAEDIVQKDHLAELEPFAFLFHETLQRFLYCLSFHENIHLLSFLLDLKLFLQHHYYPHRIYQQRAFLLGDREESFLEVAQNIVEIVV